MAKKKTAKKQGTRKSDLKKKRVNKARSDKIFLWTQRAVMGVCALALVVWCVAWFILSGANAASSNWIHAKTLKLTADMGFRVEEILVEGRKYSDGEAILALINVKAGDPIFFLKPDEAKEQIERITWVESVRVERRLPQTVYISLTEREPTALWEKDGKVFVVDSNGNTLTNQRLDLFKDLIMIRGEDAPKYSKDFIAMLESEEEIIDFIDHAKLIDKRRWDLILKDGKRIKLPEHEAFLAIRTILDKHNEDGLLNKQSVSDIDARQAGRLIVKTKLGKVQDYKSNTNDNLGTPL